MPLTFPANPTNGQIYDQYFYDATAQTWRVYGSDTGITNVLATKANLNGGNTFSGTQDISGAVNATSFTTSNVSVIPRFLQVVNNGALATDYSFTIAQRSICQFAFSASGYSNAQVLRNWTLVINSTTVAQTKHFFNSVSFHAACLTGVGTITLNAGTYNARVNYDGTFDTNDFCTIWATIIPTA